MSLWLHKKTPALLSILARGPWAEIGTQERTGSPIPATVLTGGEEKEGEEQEEVTGYLGVVLARQEATGGVLSAVAVAQLMLITMFKHQISD